MVNSLLKDGFAGERLFCGEDEKLDELLQPLDMIHVMDADSSQALAIEDVKRGSNLVIQGPPGTGKSQTIANLIATAVKEGKKVLFVSEKMAALEVVKRRLDNVGLGDMCLELHSNKSNKRAVLDELKRTLSLGRPDVGSVTKHAEELKEHRDRLNRHAEMMHTYLEPARVTPYQAMGELVRLQAQGIPPADFTLVNCRAWSSSDWRARQGLLRDLAVQMQEIGQPAKHPWRGVELSSILSTDVQRIADLIPGIAKKVDQLIAASGQLADLINQPAPDTLSSVLKMARLGRQLAQAPEMDREAIRSDLWSTHRGEIDDVIALGRAFSECHNRLADLVVDMAWTTDVRQARRDLAAYGESWFRIFRREYRDAQATLRGILKAPLTQPLKDRIRILDDLIQAQRLNKTLKTDERTTKLGQQSFGRLWRGSISDWSALENISKWESECRALKVSEEARQIVGKIDDEAAIATLVKQISRELKPVRSGIEDLFNRVCFNIEVAFCVCDIRRIPLADLAARLSLWLSNQEGISKWIAYFARWRKLERQGMQALAERLDEGIIATDQAIDNFEMAYYEELMREAYERCPELSEFNGASHEQVLKRFKELDTERLTFSRKEVAAAHYDGLPTHESSSGEIGVLRKQMTLKRRHLPLRKLLEQAGHAVQPIKPVFMMSPISIAQFLKPGVLEFDLLLIDEASQVKPVDAMGAIARARQMVVVGDDRQLPPTRFFSHVVGDDGGEPNDADDFQTRDVESILGLCEAQNMAKRMLRWHYRSRHPSLIAVSNHEFYESRLHIIPSPLTDQSGAGLRFHHCANGIYDRGGSSTNRIEARAVADAVMKHARQCPENTLGVGAFSVAQRDAILEELELRRRNSPDLEQFFSTAAAEPFFVKNLENIQGDERDVILISVGYGKDESGFMAMNFGPLSSDGGERRLNVLITRARERCEVFTSITSDDIDLNRTRARGPRALKTFLAYARSGFLDVGDTTDRDFDSDFELQVARAIESCGYRVDMQVGVAGFFIDLAVVDPELSGRYLLGIECDGATYHSSRWARDRDRLRQQVLEDRGWVIHRIWSTDWFQRQEEQLQKTLAAIDQASMTWAERQSPDAKPKTVHIAVPEVIDRQVVDLESEATQSPIRSVPYVEADFALQTARVLQDVPPGTLARVVAKVVEIEGPVHQDEVARRVTSLWGLRRTGNRIANAVEEALAIAVDERLVVQAGLFFQPPDLQEIPIRNREAVESKNLRKPEYLPPVEIRAALEAVISAHLGISREETTKETSRLFGYRSASAQLIQIVGDEIKTLISDRAVELRNEKLYVSSPSTNAIIA